MNLTQCKMVLICKEWYCILLKADNTEVYPGVKIKNITPAQSDALDTYASDEPNELPKCILLPARIMFTPDGKLLRLVVFTKDHSGVLIDYSC